MATITFKANPLTTIGNLPAVGQQAPHFTLTNVDLAEISYHDFQGKWLVMNIFPSLDTPTCAMSVRKFNEQADQLNNTAILCISADLPFAQKRFCGAEGLKKVISASVFRHPEFGKSYGVTITEGPLAGLLARAIVILDKQGKVVYTEQVSELTAEPNYEMALKMLV